MTDVLVVEDFRAISDDELEKLAELAADKVAATRERIVTDLGLRLQRTRSIEEACKFYGEPLTDHEYGVWTGFLPTSYSKERGGWQSYSFDRIPNGVLQEIQTADSLALFHDLRIWTPERQKLDPMVVGVIYDGAKTYYFKIVRWGESLASYSSIEQVVKLRQRLVKRWSRVQITLTLLVAAALVGLAAENALKTSRNVTASLIGLGWLGAMMTFAVLLIGSVLTSHWARGRGLKRYQVEPTWTPENVPALQATV